MLSTSLRNLSLTTSIWLPASLSKASIWFLMLKNAASFSTISLRPMLVDIFREYSDLLRTAESHLNSDERTWCKYYTQSIEKIASGHRMKRSNRRSFERKHISFPPSKTKSKNQKHTYFVVENVLRKKKKKKLVTYKARKHNIEENTTQLCCPRAEIHLAAITTQQNIKQHIWCTMLDHRNNTITKMRRRKNSTRICFLKMKCTINVKKYQPQSTHMHRQTSTLRQEEEENSL